MHVTLIALARDSYYVFHLWAALDDKLAAWNTINKQCLVRVYLKPSDTPVSIVVICPTFSIVLVKIAVIGLEQGLIFKLEYNSTGKWDVRFMFISKSNKLILYNVTI